MPNTIPANGGAMAANGTKPPGHIIADELDEVKSLIDVGYMAAAEISESQRDAMRGLLGLASTKIEIAIRTFDKAYCGGHPHV